MSETTPLFRSLADYMFYVNIVTDPDKVQYLADILEGHSPHEPYDNALRTLYKNTAAKVLAATGTEGQALRAIVKHARAQVYTDEDYSRADFVGWGEDE